MTSPLNKRKPGRRGRPKKNYNEIKTTPFLPEKPREERSYEDFFPDLNVKEPLPVIKIHTSTLNEVPMTTDRKTIEKESLPVPSYIRIAQENKLVKSDSVCYQHTRADNEYIRYIEPSESELFDTVEYDMDEQDQTWLKILNNQRKKEGLGEISGDVFEKVIDQLEKEWFNLIKSVPKKYECQLNSLDDAKCAVCDDGECENSNAIVFCDGCNLAVHQDCYGIPYIPEGQWLCRKCMVSPEHPVSCIFCPREGGAFKQTTTNQWGHLICAIWIPEVNLSNSVYMEPIDNIENIPKNRWKLTCSICRQRHGACIQCDHKHCFVAFHVTCARWARLCMRMKLHGTQHDGANLKAYCDRHTPRDYKEQVDVDKWMTAAQQWFMDPTRKKKKHMIPLTRYINEELETREKGEHIPQKRKTGTGGHNVKRQKRHQYLFQLIPPLKEARAHQHHFSADVPIAPDYILHKLESMVNSCQNEKIRKKALLITNISRYWSLKRGARRGTPLLKRLHLEPWTASSSQLKQTEVEKAHKAAAMINLRADLEKLRMLSEQVQKREKQKLDVMRKQKAYLEIILYPVEYIARSALNSLIE
ncbi:PHD-zinc-finger like domain-containing protein [Pilobolus umbonatus]|nr:PHD-zinc-finger like domain-containing protein [Pilobolus umbonatus]